MAITLIGIGIAIVLLIKYYRRLDQEITEIYNQIRNDSITVLQIQGQVLDLIDLQGSRVQGSQQSQPDSYQLGRTVGLDPPTIRFDQQRNILNIDYRRLQRNREIALQSIRTGSSIGSILRTPTPAVIRNISGSSQAPV